MNKITTLFLVVIVIGYLIPPLFASRESRRNSNLPTLYDTNRERVQGSIRGSQQYYYYKHNPRFTPQNTEQQYYYNQPGYEDRGYNYQYED